MKFLKVDHDYYCNLQNYFSNDTVTEFECWEDFKSEFLDADKSYNLLFRWDLIKDEDTNDLKLHLFYMAQRKGRYFSVVVNVKEDDEKEESEIKDFLKSYWDFLTELWNPVSKLMLK